MPQSLVTTADAADILGTHTATVRRMVERGELRAALKAPGKRGGFFFRRADVERLAAKRAA